MKRQKRTGLRFIPRTKEVLKILKKYWDGYKEVEAEFRHSVAKLEIELQNELKESEIGFIRDGGTIVGIGSQDSKKLKPVLAKDLEKLNDTGHQTN